MAECLFVFWSVGISSRISIDFLISHGKTVDYLHVGGWLQDAVKLRYSSQASPGRQHRTPPFLYIDSVSFFSVLSAQNRFHVCTYRVCTILVL